MDNVSESGLRLGRELGMPDGMDAVTLTMDAEAINPDWKGYTLEFVGDRQLPPSREFDYIYAESEGIGIQVWRLRVQRDGVQAYIEARTRPGWYGFVDRDLRNLDPHRLEDNKKVLDFLPNLYPHRIRPSRSQGRTLTLQDVASAYIAVYKETSQHPTQVDVAAQLGCDARTVRRVVGESGEPWPDFSERIRRSLRSRTIALPRR